MIGALVALALAAGGDDAPPRVRFATFNASLNRARAGQLIEDLSKADNAQAKNVAEVVQLTRPDVLLINEFDYDPEGRAAKLFQENYLGVGQRGNDPIVYPHVYVPDVNTGRPSGLDLDGNGRAVVEPGGRGYGEDALGFGLFPGQYGMALYSKYPIKTADAKTFRELRWRDFPGAKAPTLPNDRPFYSPEAWDAMRLSSKTHADVPIAIGEKVVHALISHPTPPAFDGPEGRNKLRNRDEVRFWALYVSDGPERAALAPDGGGPVPPVPGSFVVMGDLNADPMDGAGLPGGIDALLSAPRVNGEHAPTGDGGSEAAIMDGGVNSRHRGIARRDTADFNDNGPGNLRVDYVLPSKDLRVLGSAVFWRPTDEPLARLFAMGNGPATSDHRLVYVDLEVK